MLVTAAAGEVPPQREASAISWIWCTRRPQLMCNTSVMWCDMNDATDAIVDCHRFQLKCVQINFLNGNDECCTENWNKIETKGFKR